MVNPTKYGHFPAGAGEAVALEAHVLSLDLRQQTGGADLPDETGWLPPGTVAQTVFPTVDGMLPVGEIRLLVRGVEIHVVAQPTGRTLRELTPEHVRACLQDPEYQATIANWVGLA